MCIASGCLVIQKFYQIFRNFCGEPHKPCYEENSLLSQPLSSTFQFNLKLRSQVKRAGATDSRQSGPTLAPELLSVCCMSSAMHTGNTELAYRPSAGAV